MNEATAMTAYPAEFIGLIRTTNLDKAKVDAILEEFRTAISIDEVEAEARSIVVTDASQTALVLQARTLRLQLKNERVRIDKTRKELKEGAKREVDLIDGIGRILREKIEPLEAHLQEQEDFAARQEAARIAEMVADRTARLSPYVENVSVYNLAAMPEEDFSRLVQSSIDAQTAKIEAEKRIEAERLAEQKRRDDEAAALRVENERLRVENETREREAAEQRRLADFERQERERIENEARQKEFAAAEEKRKAKQAEADRIAAEQKTAEDAQRAKDLAPDRDKLLLYVSDVKAYSQINLPSVASPEALALLTAFNSTFTTALDQFEAGAKALLSDCPF